MEGERNTLIEVKKSALARGIRREREREREEEEAEEREYELGSI